MALYGKLRDGELVTMVATTLEEERRLKEAGLALSLNATELNTSEKRTIVYV
jgi:hypothetical protein